MNGNYYKYIKRLGTKKLLLIYNRYVEIIWDIDIDIDMDIKLQDKLVYKYNYILLYISR